MAVSAESLTETGFIQAQRLIRMRYAIDLQELAFARACAEFAETDFYDEDGSNTPIDWIRINCHMTSQTAADRVAVGRQVPNLTHSVAAMAHGDIGFAHITVMARTANAVPDRFDETALLDQAVKSSPGKFHYFCRHYRHAADPVRYAAEQAEMAENRHLSIFTTDEGWVQIDGMLDPVGGAAVRTALEPLARRSGEHDDRHREQRLADALVELVSMGVRPRMQVTSSLETLLNLVGAPGAEMEFSLPVSSRTVERFACDCSLTRVLMQDSVVIDVGRTKRVLDGSRRRALIARDRHCVWPGCERPASWSDGHHLVHWIHGGSSDLDNLVLLCHRHHWKVHEGGWQIVKTGDGQFMAVPPTITFGARPRGPD